MEATGRGAAGRGVTGSRRRPEVVVVHSDQRPPDGWDAAVLLADDEAVPRPGADRWWPRAIRLLTELWSADGLLVVFLPVAAADGAAPRAAADPEAAAGRADLSDLVICWSPATPLAWPPALTEPGRSGCCDTGRLVVGAPMPSAYASEQAWPVPATLAATVRTALDRIGEGAYRTGAEREVPLSIWRTGSFHRWHAAQHAAGNTLLGARLVWSFLVGAGSEPFVFYWALHVRVHIGAEDRVKDNEVVISRPDVSAILLYRRGSSLDETTIVLVREFRSAVSTPDGFGHELPGGSALEPLEPLALAVQEAQEEIGLAIDAARVRAHGSRQLAATVSAHHCHLFSAELTEAELERLRAARHRPYGIVGDTERTWIEIATFGQIRAARLVDWSTLGMIAQVLSCPEPAG